MRLVRHEHELRRWIPERLEHAYPAPTPEAGGAE